MNAAQTNLYFREWGEVRKHFLAKGIDPKQTDAKRHELHAKALGKMKSSKLFTNADLDKVLSVFWAITKPADLNAQLRQQDQQIERLRKMQNDCRDLVRRLPKMAEARDPDFYVRNYLNTVAESHAGCAFAMLEEKALARVLGILRHRLGEAVPFLMDQAVQCEMVFKAEVNPATTATLDQIEWLAGLLKGRGWMTAAKLVTMGGVKDERKIRAIARAAAPGIVSFPGSPGYKLWGECSVEEINHCLNAWDSQIRDNTARRQLYAGAYYSRMRGAQ